MHSWSDRLQTDEDEIVPFVLQEQSELFKIKYHYQLLLYIFQLLKSMLILPLHILLLEVQYHPLRQSVHSFPLYPLPLAQLQVADSSVQIEDESLVPDKLQLHSLQLLSFEVQYQPVRHSVQLSPVYPFDDLQVPQSPVLSSQVVVFPLVPVVLQLQSRQVLSIPLQNQPSRQSAHLSPVYPLDVRQEPHFPVSSLQVFVFPLMPVVLQLHSETIEWFTFHQTVAVF